MTKTFQGRAVLPGHIEGEALVTHTGFNAYASFSASLQSKAKTAQCADSGNHELYGKDMAGKILCLPKTIGSTSAGAVWQRIIHLGIAPIAVLFSHRIDPLAAAGLVVADMWTDQRIYTVDKLGSDFLKTVKDGDQIVIHQDGTVLIG